MGRLKQLASLRINKKNPKKKPNIVFSHLHNKIEELTFYEIMAKEKSEKAPVSASQIEEWKRVKKIGIIGLGDMGQLYAKKFHEFGWR